MMHMQNVQGKNRYAGFKIEKETHVALKDDPNFPKKNAACSC